MAKELFKRTRIDAAGLQMIELINEIVEEYQAQRYTLTVRQLYYQLVARDHIPNNLQSYKRLVHITTTGRLSGLIDWAAIEDNLRQFDVRSMWKDPADFGASVGPQYRTDPWLDQPCRVFVVIEKDALSNVFERVCHEFDVPLLAARGYASISCLHEFAKYRMWPAIGAEQSVVILHFGDHDPSGIDMTRDLKERLKMFLAPYGADDLFIVKRLALNMDQVKKYKPPSNPAKTTDIRFKGYKEQFKTTSSWELDALSPTTLSDLARNAIETVLDDDVWVETHSKMKLDRSRIIKAMSKL